MQAMRLRHTRRRRNPRLHQIAALHQSADVCTLSGRPGGCNAGAAPRSPVDVMIDSPEEHCGHVQRDMGWGSTPSLFLAGLAAHPLGPSARLIPRLGSASTSVSM